jgi:hypothetical protein
MLLEISYDAYGPGGLRWSVHWSATLCASGFLRVQRRVRRVWATPDGPNEALCEAYLPFEALTAAQRALEPVWTTPAQDWMMLDCPVTASVQTTNRSTGTACLTKSRSEARSS